MTTKALRAAALLASVAIAFVAASAPGQQVPPQPAPGAPPATWPTRAEHVPVTYQIRAQLLETDPPDGLRVAGRETIVWENTSREPVRVLYFHTYANAFRNNRSTLIREWSKDDFKVPDDMTWGDMPMPRISVPDGDVDARWVAPDDGNADDRTVLRAELSHSVEPGAKLPITVEFTLDLPRVIRRMGRRAGFAMIAQWYPKLGRYLGKDAPYANTKACDGWYCHQYHSHAEFAADYANYDVTLEVPKGYTVGASGEPVDEREDEKKHTVVQRWRADSVVDFAWTASKRFVVVTRDVVPVLPDDLADRVTAEWRRCKGDPLPTVHVVLLLQPEHEDQAERCFRAARTALACYGSWLGPYPYPRLTIVDPPWNGGAAGGMEYPTLVTAGTVAGSPIESQRPEGVIVHEIGHQWLMNLIATNEAEEAWLDEGINTYFTAQALDIEYGPSQRVTDVLGFHFLSVPVFEFPGVSAGWPDALGLPEWAHPAKLDIFRLWRDLPPLSWVPAWNYRGDAMMLPSRRSYLRRAGWDDMVRRRGRSPTARATASTRTRVPRCSSTRCVRTCARVSAPTTATAASSARCASTRARTASATRRPPTSCGRSRERRATRRRSPTRSCARPRRSTTRSTR